ncbi:MAG: hydrogenase maturation protease [Actinomycetota bacterium]|jgi:hydrogenase maturation protease|nr:hydrogenase maturation protease [Solirubrobacterales bacterium]MDQ3408363.1 hydrogenase maturation protease [Actinomycetota bacterium]
MTPEPTGASAAEPPAVEAAPAVEPWVIAGAAPPNTGRLLVAGVGNTLRGDDGFGPAVTELLGHLPAGVDVIETGIGGIALLQELMAGCAGLILIDAVDRGAEPGTVFVLEPDVPEGEHVPDVHLANPDRVLTMAKTIGVLPDRVRIIGCQPAEVDDLFETLSPPVQAALATAVTRIEETVHAWL